MIIDAKKCEFTDMVNNRIVEVKRSEGLSCICENVHE